jgi:hypothetical protein
LFGLMAERRQKKVESKQTVKDYERRSIRKGLKAVGSVTWSGLVRERYKSTIIRFTASQQAFSLLDVLPPFALFLLTSQSSIESVFIVK